MIQERRQSRLLTIGFQLMVLTLLFVCAPRMIAASDNEGYSGISIQRARQAAQSLANIQSVYPALRAHKTGPQITRLYGTTFGGGSSPVAAAEEFRLTHANLFGVTSDNLLPGHTGNRNLTVQPLMYDRGTGAYKFSLVYYTQVLDGIDVYGSELRLLVRNEPGYPLVLAVSSLRDLNNFAADQSRVGTHSAIAEQAARANETGLTAFTEQETVIWAGVDGTPADPRTAVKFEGSSDFPEQFLFIVDPVTGEILHKRNLVIFEDVVGSVSGMATEGPKEMSCAPEVITPFPFAYVAIQGGPSTYADENGNFTIPYSGTLPVSVISPVRGQYFRVFDYLGGEVTETLTVTPPGPANFVHNNLNAYEVVRAQMNGYVNANEVRDWALTYNPTYPVIYNQTNFPVWVNRTDGYCPGNAWYDGSSINFCLSGSGYGNTAFASVSQHEYGHHLIASGGSGQGQYGEGMSDCISMLIADDPGLGYGFFAGQCDNPLRSADNNYQYPCVGGIHDCGQLLSGAVWSTRNELIVTEPGNYLEILSNLTLNSILLHLGTEITPQITIDFLTLDDDDGNIDNGTPHYNEINAGFGAHNMGAPEIVPLVFDFPTGVPTMLAPLADTTFEVVVSGQNGGIPIPGSGRLLYAIDDGAMTEVAMTEITDNYYEATLPEMNCFSTVSFYVSADAEGMGTFYNVDTTLPHRALVATESAIAVTDDFETDNGWTVSGNASDGQWNRGVPVGGGDRGDPPTDFDGSGRCYLTDNVDGNSDVDGGTTILTSPAFDLSAAGNARIEYARWYSNHAGDDPYNDVFAVYVSNDNGSSWTLVETVGPVQQAAGGWYEHAFYLTQFVAPSAEVKVRFDASDLGSGSVVEAAIDAFEITTFDCIEPPTYVCGDIDGDESDPNVADLTYLVDYFFKSGPPPPVLDAANVDGVDSEINVTDISTMVDYLFRSGPPLVCQPVL